jgi:hypothetical protein
MKLKFKAHAMDIVEEIRKLDEMTISPDPGESPCRYYERMIGMIQALRWVINPEDFAAPTVILTRNKKDDEELCPSCGEPL